MADKSKTKSNGGSKGDGKRALRSRQWFDNPDNPGMTALYLERYLNFGLTPGELRSGKPIIGIAQTGSDLSPCNRHHIELAKRTRDGITAAGGLAFEFPVHPIQETGNRTVCQTTIEAWGELPRSSNPRLVDLGRFFDFPAKQVAVKVREFRRLLGIDLKVGD